jgi:hypothetical protein
MAALTQATDRRIYGGTQRNLRSASGSVPFEGSFLSLNAAGYYDRLTAGQPFAGICRKTVLAKDAAISNGQVGSNLFAITGDFTFVAAIAGVSVTTILGRPRVYATTDNDLTLTAEAGATPVGRIIDLFTDYGDGITNGVVIQAQTFHTEDRDLGQGIGSAVLADASATLTVQQLDTVLYIPNTAARTLTLPPVASCTGRNFMVIKTNASTFAVTLQANAAENINGSNTYATATANYSMANIRSDGTQWIVIGKI